MTYLYKELLAPTRLYIKQCPHCGLKYFGKSKSKDIEKYSGSGTNWTKHLTEYNVMPTHLWNSDWYYDTSITRFALKFSRINKIVSSNKWANIIEENGLDGGWDLVNASWKNLYGYNGKTANVADNFRRGLEKQKFLRENDPIWSKEVSNKISDSITKHISEKGFHWWLGMKHSEETKKKISDKSKVHQRGTGNSQYGTIWIYSLKEKTSKKINEDQMIPDGWYCGRKMKFD
jgi:hypothetical protein